MDHPLDEILKAMDEHIREGKLVWFKYTCEKCGVRQTSAEANSYHAEGYICEECGHLTVPTQGNYMLAMTNSPEVLKKLLEKLE